MKYDVIIGQCSDSACAMKVAGTIAGWAGSTPEEVYGIITRQSACVKKGAGEAEARKLQEEYLALGARVELHPVVPGGVSDDPRCTVLPDDDDDEPGRLLSDDEYCALVQKRDDIFYFEGTTRIRNTELVALLCAIAAGAFLSTREFKTVVAEPDFFERGGREVVVVVGDKEVERPTPPEQKNVPVPARKTLAKTSRKGRGGVTGGGGDPHARVTKKGVIGILSGAIKGKTVASADLFGKGGIANSIDAIISGVGGLKSYGSAGAGRRGESGMGFGTGYESGFGGNSGGIGDLVDNLMASASAGIGDLRRRGRLEIAKPSYTVGGSITSGRSKAGILKVVMQNITALRYAYNKRLKEKPGLNGKVTVKFAIDEFGKVIFCSVKESTMGDKKLEALVVNKIRAWRFEKIDKPGDVTEVVYPFVFSQ